MTMPLSVVVILALALFASAIYYSGKSVRAMNTVMDESDYLFRGDSFEMTFDTAGTFPYRCGPHPLMTGVVVVE